jgi:hypothetical protein
MSIKSQITDPQTGLEANVVNSEEKNALVVATRTLKSYENQTKFFRDANGSVDMNVDGSAGGTPLGVYNGGDSVYWTASVIVGGARWNLTDAAQNHTPAGTASVSLTNGSSADTAQFAKGSDQDLTNYQSLTVWILINSGWSISDVVDIYGWDTGTSMMVGNQVDLGNYINILDVGVWQKASIPLGDLALQNQTIDAVRVEYTIRDGVKATFYLDDIQFEETGGGIEYTIRPLKNTWLFIDAIKVFMVDAYDSTITDGTVPGVSHSGFLGLSTLSAGILFQNIKNGEVFSSITLSDLGDFLQFASANLLDYGYDGADTWFTLTLRPVKGLQLKAEQEDYLRIVINDNMAGLVKFRITCDCYEEAR